MRTLIHAVLACSLVLTIFCLTGCGGDGFPIDAFKDSTSGDQPDDGDGGGGGVIPPDDGGGSGQDPARFRGTWFSAFSDDLAAASLTIGETHYAMFLNMTENGTDIGGTGRVFRNYISAPTALQEVAFRIDGTRQGDNDATITLTATNSGAFEFPPTWRLRLAGTRIVGIFEERSSGNELVRAGHATWYRTSSTATPAGSWAAAYSDAVGTAGFPRRDRVAIATAAQGASGVTGNGLLIEQRVEDVPEELNFEIVRGAIQQSQVGFTFGALDLSAMEVDWVGFYNQSVLMGTYAQFDNSDALVRFGHTTWRRSSNTGPDAIDGVWATAFSDSPDAAAPTPSDYLAFITLDARDGGLVVGNNAQIRDEAFDNPTFLSYDVEMGTISGTRVHFELVRASGSWIWDLQLAGNVMVGTYQQFDPSGNFLSRGVAEWFRRNTNVNFEGSWVASHTDTFVSGASGIENTQLIRVNIADQTNDGLLTGTGLLRIAGENSARTVDVTGQVTGANVAWTFSGAGLFGNTTWNLRRVNSGLVGTYINRNSAGNLEARGHAFWYPTGS